MTLEDLHHHSQAGELKQPEQELHGFLRGEREREREREREQEQVNERENVQTVRVAHVIVSECM